MSGEVRVARCDDGSWCDEHAGGAFDRCTRLARWVVFEVEDNGDGARYACDVHLAGWVDTVMRRTED